MSMVLKILSGRPAVLMILPFFNPITTPSAASQNCSLFSILRKIKRLFGPFPIFAEIDAYGKLDIYSRVISGPGISWKVNLYASITVLPILFSPQLDKSSEASDPLINHLLEICN